MRVSSLLCLSTKYHMLEPGKLLPVDLVSGEGFLINRWSSFRWVFTCQKELGNSVRPLFWGPS